MTCPDGTGSNAAGKTSEKTAAAFQCGLPDLAQYIAREGHHRVPRGRAEEIAVEGEDALVVVKLGVWGLNTKSRSDKLTPQQQALTDLGLDWASA